MTGLRWTRKTTEKIADELRLAGFAVSPNTVARLLKQLDFRLRANEKKIRTRSGGREGAACGGRCFG